MCSMGELQYLQLQKQGQHSNEIETIEFKLDGSRFYFTKKYSKYVVAIRVISTYGFNLVSVLAV